MQTKAIQAWLSLMTKGSSARFLQWSFLPVSVEPDAAVEHEAFWALVFIFLVHVISVYRIATTVARRSICWASTIPQYGLFLYSKETRRAAELGTTLQRPFLYLRINPTINSSFRWSLSVLSPKASEVDLTA